MTNTHLNVIIKNNVDKKNNIIIYISFIVFILLGFINIDNNIFIGNSLLNFIYKFTILSFSPKRSSKLVLVPKIKRVSCSYPGCSFLTASEKSSAVSEAIISKETFQAVQLEKQHRSNMIEGEDGNQRKNKKYSSKRK